MNKPVRTPMLVDLMPAPADELGRTAARAQNFSIERVQSGPAASHRFASEREIILLLPHAGGTLSGDRAIALPGHSVVIIPAGAYAFALDRPAAFYLLATHREQADMAMPRNADAYASHDARVRPVGKAYERIAHGGDVRIHRIEDVTIPPDNGRLRFLQSETMSINWVEYDGLRDNSALSPHAHADLEQASLAIEGQFTHHLRTPWGRDARLWQEDQHLHAGPASVVVIPPEIIHTTEGVGDGKHVLVDVFAPPRADFIAKGWVFNAHEYQAQAEPAA
ncbi:hypothetical protein M2333_003055 [Sphingobium sp. B11D3B]|uniref:hypothetical protein n=1 Tax=Sphingobium sp. B11D3B TaxID=2940575 RepID=UPI00222692A9|nr:hypothetical protein [Sphingobium sp. B11D3B]MCW2390009.1 hypothetical protein [Sphingobium sp. B11D3B]